MDSLIEIVRDFETAALTPASNAASLPFEPDLCRALIRSRRLRVVDWLAQSGFSLLNVLDGIEQAFLEMADTCDLSDKYCAARQFRNFLRPQLSARPWMDQIARLEVMLIEARRARPDPPSISGDAEQVILVPEATLDSIDLDAALELHSMLPAYDIPAEQRPPFRRLIESRAGTPAPATVLAVGPASRTDGFVASIQPDLAAILARARTPVAWGDIRARLDSETAAMLLDQQLISPYTVVSNA